MWQLEGPVELLDQDTLETNQVIRQAGPTAYVDGLPTSPGATVFFITSTVQPMGGKDLLLVPEAFRQHESLWLWQPHYGGQAEVLIDIGDVVLRQNKGYQVASSEDWGDYTRAMLVRIDVGTLRGALDAAGLPPLFEDPAANLLDQDF